MADDFLAVLDAFPELAGKKIYVTEMNAFGDRSDFLPALARRIASRPDLMIVGLEFQREDFFRYDGHLTVDGNRRVTAQLARAIRGGDADVHGGEAAAGAARR